MGLSFYPTVLDYLAGTLPESIKPNESKINMRYIVTLSNNTDISRAITLPVEEIIVETASFSRFGHITDDELSGVIRSLVQAGKKVFLQWDLLCKDQEIEALTKLFQKLPLSKLHAVRFQDVGIGRLLQQSFPDLHLVFIAETGNHNSLALQKWCAYFQTQLVGVVLSGEIPLQDIAKFRTTIPVKIEILGAGRIPLFYSPRSLIRPFLPSDTSSETQQLKVASEDRPHQWMTTMENPHGTFLFYHKELFLLPDIEEIEKAGIDRLRLDLSDSLRQEWVEKYLSAKQRGEEWSAAWPNPTTRGFFRSNKTEAPLRRLNNPFLTKATPQKIGTVIESSRESHLVIVFTEPVDFPTQLLFHTPEGKTVEKTVEGVQSLFEEKRLLDRVKPGYYILPWLKWVVPASVIERSF